MRANRSTLSNRVSLIMGPVIPNTASSSKSHSTVASWTGECTGDNVACYHDSWLLAALGLT